MIPATLQLLAVTDKAADAAKRATEASTDLWTRLGNYQVPSSQEIVNAVQSLEPWQAALLIGMGLVYLLQGWKIFKILVIVNAAVLGAMAGSMIGALQDQQWSLYGAIIGAAALAILAWPLMKFAISLMGALAGGFAGFSLWRYVSTVTSHTDLTQYSWVGGLIGLVLLGALAFLLFHLVVILFTSLQGSMLVVAGIVSLVLRYPPLHKNLYDSLVNDPHLLPALVAIPAAIGLIAQAAGWGKNRKKPAEPKKEEK